MVLYLAHLLLGGQVLLHIGLDAAEHEGPQDGMQLLDDVVAGALIGLQADS